MPTITLPKRGNAIDVQIKQSGLFGAEIKIKSRVFAKLIKALLAATPNFSHNTLPEDIRSLVAPSAEWPHSAAWLLDPKLDKGVTVKTTRSMDADLDAFKTTLQQVTVSLFKTYLVEKETQDWRLTWNWKAKTNNSETESND